MELTPNAKGCDRSEGWGESKGGSTWNGSNSEVGNTKGQAKGKGKGVVNVNETAATGEAKVAGPRLRDSIQEEVDEIVSINSNLFRSDFDGRVFQYLHAIHCVGGQEKVRKALQTIHLSTLQKQRNAVKKWPAYLATLLRKFFEDLGAEKKVERENAKVEAETYANQLSKSVDALFEAPIPLAPVGPKGEAGSNPAANPQEAGASRGSPQEWLHQVVTEEREQQWLKRGSDLLLSAVTAEPVSPVAIRSIPPGFTPPEVPSPSHVSMYASSPQHLGMISPPPGTMFVSTPLAHVSRSPPPFSPPPPPVPQLPPPPPPLPLHVHDPFKQQQTVPLAHPLQASAQVPTNREAARMISPPSAPPAKKNQQQSHQPRVVPPPPRKQKQVPSTAPPTAPPVAPPTDASGAQLIAKSTSLSSIRPPPWPAQYVTDA